MRYRPVEFMEPFKTRDALTIQGLRTLDSVSAGVLKTPQWISGMDILCGPCGFFFLG